MENFKKQLQDIQDAVKVVRQNQAQQKPSKNVKLGAPFPQYVLKESSVSVLHTFFSLVTDDTSRFQAEQPQEEVQDSTDAADDTTETQQPQAITTPYSESFKELFTFDATHKMPESASAIQGKPNELGKPEKQLCILIAQEIDFIGDNLATLSYSINSMNKLKKVYEAICTNNVMDAVTILRTTCKEEPNNKSIPFILSQVYYYLASLGRSEIFPQANKQAAVSTALNDKFDDLKLLSYRYTHAASVIAHAPEQALQLIRDYALLNPEDVLTNQGMAANNGIHLKSFMLLSKIPTKFWGAEEVKALLDLTVKVAGGALIYIHFIRPQLIDMLNNESNDTFHSLIDIEKSLQKALYLYNYTVEPLAGAAATGLKMPWTVQNQYQSHFAKVSETPSFDEVLMFVSLDAGKYYLDAYPSQLVENSALQGCTYWYAWANTISPYEDGITKGYIPFAHLAPEVAILKLFEKLVISLEGVERSLTPQDKWGIIKPYMPHYTYNSFLDVGAKGQATSGVKNTADPYFKSIFNGWFEKNPAIQAPLPSQIMRARAMAGIFTTLEEVCTAFKGISIIIADPVHGLKIRAKQALKKCLADKSKLGKNESLSIKEELFKGHFKDFWWFYLLLLPFSILTFFILLTADNYLQAIKMLSIIIIACMGIGFVVYYFFKMPKEDQAAETQKK